MGVVEHEVARGERRGHEADILLTRPAAQNRLEEHLIGHRHGRDIEPEMHGGFFVGDGFARRFVFFVWVAACCGFIQEPGALLDREGVAVEALYLAF